MESFFVPIYIKLGKIDEEKLLVALMMVTPEKVWFQYSSKRIQIAGQIANPGMKILTQEVFDQIHNKADEVNKQLSDANKIQFSKFHVFTSEYFEYLKKYSQNTLLFGNIEKFNYKKTTLNFKNLFESFFNEKSEVVKDYKPSFHTNVKIKFKNAGIEEKADIDFKIKPTQLLGLNNEMIVSLISKNGGVIAAESMDFSNSIQSITNSLNAFDVLVFSLTKFSDKHKLKKGKYHLIASKPDTNSAQEKLFNNIYKNKKENYKVTMEEGIEDITTEIKSGSYTKFSSFFVAK